MENLKLYDRNILWSVGAMLVSCLTIFLGRILFSGTPAVLQAVLVLLLYLISLWLGLRFALSPNDHLALGKFGRTMRLTS